MMIQDEDSGKTGFCLSCETLARENEALKRERAMLVDALKFYASDDFSHRCPKCDEVDTDICISSTAKATLSDTEPQATQWLNDKLSAEVSKESARLGAIIENHIDDMTYVLQQAGVLVGDQLPGTVWGNNGCRINRDKVADQLSSAKQEGYEQGWDNASYSVSKDVEQARAEGKQAGRDEVLRELSERQPDAWVNVSNTMGRRLSWYKNPQSNSHEVLIIRPSAPEKGNKL